MTHGGYRDEREEWPPPRPRHAPADDRYEPDGAQPPPGHASAPPAPAMGGTPWYGQRPHATPYGTPTDGGRQRYPDAYLSEPESYAPQRYEPTTAYPSDPARRPPAGPAGWPGGRPGDEPTWG